MNKPKTTPGIVRAVIKVDPSVAKAKASTEAAKVEAKNKDRQEELRKKLMQQWREKTANAWKSGSRTDHIKSVGNGL